MDTPRDFYLLTDFALVSSLRVSSSSAQEAVKQALIKSFSAFSVSATRPLIGHTKLLANVTSIVAL